MAECPGSVTYIWYELATSSMRHTWNTHVAVMSKQGGSGGPAGMVWAGPLLEFLTLLLAINHYETIN